MNKAKIQYEKHSKQDRVRVDKYMIPTLIKEEAQGKALIRTLHIYEKEKYRQINALINIMNCYLKRTEQARERWDARQKITLNILLIKQKEKGEKWKLRETENKIAELENLPAKEDTRHPLNRKKSKCEKK